MFNTRAQPPPKRALETARHTLSLAALLVSVNLPAACTALSDSGADPLGAMTAEDLDGQLMALLRALFPDLSDAERHEMLQQLDTEQILALRDELEAARDAAAEFSDELFMSAEERAAERQETLSAHSGSYPEALDALGLICATDGVRGGPRVTVRSLRRWPALQSRRRRRAGHLRRGAAARPRRRPRRRPRCALSVRASPRCLPPGASPSAR